MVPYPYNNKIFVNAVSSRSLKIGRQDEITIDMQDMFVLLTSNFPKL